MTFRTLSDNLAVAPQIDPEDFAELVQAGYTTIINNRPDPEVEPSHQSDRMAEHAARAGLEYHYLPIFPGQLGPETVQRFREIVEGASGPVLAHCRSGTRSATAWALGQSGRLPARQILDSARQAGYDLSYLAPVLKD